MKKVMKDKRILITVVAIVLLLMIIIIMAVTCGKKENAKSGKEPIGKETIENENIDKPDNKTEEGKGLDVAGPDEADKENETGVVEFVEPEISEDGNTIESGSENQEEKGNLDDEEDNTGQYGEFF